MGRVRVQLDFVIEGPWRGTPDGMDRVVDFIAAGLEGVGVLSPGAVVDVLPGARLKMTVVRRKGAVR